MFFVSGSNDYLPARHLWAGRPYPAFAGGVLCRLVVVSHFCPTAILKDVTTADEQTRPLRELRLVDGTG